MLYRSIITSISLVTLIIISTVVCRAQNVTTAIVAEGCSGEFSKILVNETKDLVVAAGTCNDLVIVRGYGADLRERWRIDEVGFERPTVVDAAMDANGSVYVTAYDAYNFDSLIVYKFRSNGEQLWRQAVGRYRGFGEMPPQAVLSSRGGLFLVYSTPAPDQWRHLVVTRIASDGKLAWDQNLFYHQADATAAIPVPLENGSLRISATFRYTSSVSSPTNHIVDLMVHESGLHNNLYYYNDYVQVLPEKISVLSAGQHSTGDLSVLTVHQETDMLTSDVWNVDVDRNLRWRFTQSMHAVSSADLRRALDGSTYLVASEQTRPWSPAYSSVSCITPDGTLRWRRNQPGAMGPVHTISTGIGAIETDFGGDLYIAGMAFDTLAVERISVDGARRWRGGYNMAGTPHGVGRPVDLEIGSGGGVYVACASGMNPEALNTFTIVRLSQWTPTSVIAEREKNASEMFSSTPAAYPNLVADMTTIRYELLDAAPVTIEIYNAMGERVAPIIRREEERGEHEIPISARELGLTPGFYILRTIAGKETGASTFRVVE